MAVEAHSHPVGELTVADAHRVMQLHTECTVEGCRNKRAAYLTLVRAGHLVPDSGRPHWLL
ncbi:hypothetical protein EBN03_11400 [Nocardia stercoris]|uniref:Uncharacterized protein n=2 Tax=Nocardia stercoris TaxID=2483361 RepID=A0A3M2L6L0_9NOCA|nr:hypothetical protein EBN03_11400 [Nocardia stercoris]